MYVYQIIPRVKRQASIAGRAFHIVDQSHAVLVESNPPPPSLCDVLYAVVVAVPSLRLVDVLLRLHTRHHGTTGKHSITPYMS